MNARALELALIEQEIERRRATRKDDGKLRGLLFDRQREVWDALEGGARTIAVRGSRRSGKSVLAAAWLLHRARTSKRPGFLFPYIAQSRKTAKLIVWQELKAIARSCGLAVHINESDLSVTFGHNGCSVILGGCNDRSQVERYRGLRCGAAVIDEAGAMPWLEELENTLRPSLMDVAGPLMIMGNPGLVWSGRWFDLSGPGRDVDVPLYSWTLFDNPKIPAAHDEAYREKAERGWSDDDPTWLREYLGQWSYDEDALVFPLSAQDGMAVLPTLARDGWRYVLGIDVGQVDASGFALWGCHPNSKHDYLIETHKESGMLIDAHAKRIRDAMRKYPGLAVVMDTGGMGKQHAEELRRRFGIPVHAADKRDKESAIRVLRDRVRAGSVKVLAGEQNDAIRDEWCVLQWNDKRDDFAADQEDHATDAALYAHRRMRNYLYAPVEQRPAPGSAEAANETERRLEESHEKRYARQRRQNRYAWDR